MKEQYPKMATIFPKIMDKIEGSPSVRMLRHNHIYIIAVDMIENEVVITDQERVYVIDLDITNFRWYLRKFDHLTKSITEENRYNGTLEAITYDSPITYEEWITDVVPTDKYFAQVVANFFTHIGKERLDFELERALSNELINL